MRLSDNEKRKQQFIQQAIEKYGNRYDYSKVVYNTNNVDVTIICPIHGEFQQRPANHLTSKEGCYQCGKKRAGINHRITLDDFINRARHTHGDRYIYKNVKYVGAFDKVEIICNKHGSFFQTPNDHAYHGCGCSQCGFESNQSKSELRICEILILNKIDFIPQYSFDNLLALDGKNKLRYDFYLPKHNMLIEFDGPHHIQPTQYPSTTKEQAEKTHRLTVLYDRQKTEYAAKNGIRLERIPFTVHYAELEKILQGFFSS